MSSTRYDALKCSTRERQLGESVLAVVLCAYKHGEFVYNAYSLIANNLLTFRPPI
jgi:hypothetical protein